MSDRASFRRLADLLIDPRESLDVEAKAWLDLKGNRDHKAVLAKAIIALANHGGGYVLIGFDDTPTGLLPTAPPPNLDGYSQDLVNGIVQAFAEPSFHCGVTFAAGPTGNMHPIISVPGGHKVPVRTLRGSPDSTTVTSNSIYIRGPGPKSEPPRNAQEWDALLARCLAARKDELLESIRILISGAALSGAPPVPDAALEKWTARCRSRWEELVAPLPTADGRRCKLGRYWFSYELEGDLSTATVPELRDMMERSSVRHSGWSPWWVPTRVGIEPYYRDEALECWIGRDGETDAAHSDFWRVSPEGRGYLMRGYQEDGPEVAPRGVEPGTTLDLALPIWRAGEALLRVADLALKLEAASTVTFTAGYEGLQGRRLKSISNELWDDGGGVSQDDAVKLVTTVPVPIDLGELA